MNPFVECPTTALRTAPPTASTALRTAPPTAGAPATTSTAQLVAENANTIRKTSGKTYKCGICGQPKQGHICPGKGVAGVGTSGKGVVKASGQVVGVGADMQGHKQQMCEWYLAMLEKKAALKTAEIRIAAAKRILELSDTEAAKDEARNKLKNLLKSSLSGSLYGPVNVTDASQTSFEQVQERQFAVQRMQMHAETAELKLSNLEFERLAIEEVHMSHQSQFSRTQAKLEKKHAEELALLQEQHAKELSKVRDQHLAVIADRDRRLRDNEAAKCESSKKLVQLLQQTRDTEFFDHTPRASCASMSGSMPAEAPSRATPLSLPGNDTDEQREGLNLTDTSEGTDGAEKGIQAAEQIKRARITNQATTTKPSPRAANAFVVALAAIPALDWCRTWAADRTIMLRMTSKSVKDILDRMRPPADVRLSRSFWNDPRNVVGTASQKLDSKTGKLDHILAQLAAMRESWRMVRLELPCILGTDYHWRPTGELEREGERRGAFLEMLAGVLAQCPTLTHLDLSGNDLGKKICGADEIGRLAGILAQCPSLAHLNLSNNCILDDRLARLAEVLPQCTALAHLSLSHNNIGSGGAESLAGVLAQCTALTHLDLCFNNIEFSSSGDQCGAGLLVAALPKCRALSHLNLSHNFFKTTGVGRLAGVLAQCPSLSHLNLSYNYIRNDGAGLLAGVLGQCVALAHLDLGSNDIGVPGAVKLAGALAQCRALAHLVLGRNQIKPTGTAKLAEVLGQCRELTHLDLSWNLMCSLGKGRLAGVLPQLSGLTHLDLSHTGHHDADGLRTLARVLPQCRALTHLNLSGCTGKNAEGLGTLARVLPQCRALAHLSLRNNAIGPKGAGMLAGVLVQCPALTHLELSNNGIGPDGAVMLARVLAQCAALAHLDLSKNGISLRSDGAKRLRDSWRGQASSLLLGDQGPLIK